MTIKDLREWEKKTGYDSDWARVHKYNTNPIFREMDKKRSLNYYYKKKIEKKDQDYEKTN